MMKTTSLLILSLFHTATIVTAVASNKTVTYDPGELLARIFKSNITIESRQRGYGFVKFEDQRDPGIDPDNQEHGQYGLSDFERDQRPLKFEDNNDYDGQDYDPHYTPGNGQHSDSNRPLKFEDSEQHQDLASNNGGVIFQDDNIVDDQGNKKKRKRRRRRKPKNGVLPYYQGAGNGLPPGRPGFQEPFQGGYGLNPYGNPEYPGTQPFRRPRRPRPRPSLATEALSSITGALTSIALYDDYQCVPRLLCEAAGGGSLSDNGVLQSIAGIQPLLTLLSGYNGLSTSPLFVFGRAVFLGMTSKGNTGTCRYAYPQCPTDPEELIFYLNNHNGGFFRFFNAPQLPNQNVEQFYNQLSQGYPQQPYTGQSSYGYPSDPNSSQHYGLYPNAQYQEYPRPGPYDSQYNAQNYGLQRPGSYDNPSLYNNQMYGPNYAYENNYYGPGNRIRFKDSNNRIEKRIQNRPAQNFANDSFEDDDEPTKWHFPDDQFENLNNNEYTIRDSRTLKFPGEDQSYNNHKDSNRQGKRLYFPGDQNYENYESNRQQFLTNNNRYQTTTYSYNNGQNNRNSYYNNQQQYTNDRYQTSTYSYNNGQNNHNNYYNNQQYTNDRYQTSTYSYNNGQNIQNYYSNRPITYNNNNKYPATKYHNYNYDPNQNDNNYQNNNNYYNNRQNIYNNNYKYPTTTYNNEEYVFDHKHNFYVKKESNYVNHVNNYKRKEEDDGSKTVYVIRGNGDPNRPEIVKLRPGQSVY